MQVKVLGVHGVRLLATPWTVVRQAPLSMESSGQECRSGQPFPSPGDLPNPGIEPGSPTFQADSSPSEPPGWYPLQQRIITPAIVCQDLPLICSASEHRFHLMLTATSWGMLCCYPSPSRWGNWTWKRINNYLRSQHWEGAGPEGDSKATQWVTILYIFTQREVLEMGFLVKTLLVGAFIATLSAKTLALEKCGDALSA